MRFTALLLLILFSAQVTPQTARDYYNEIYAAGGLDRMADGYVCFDEDTTNQNFFIFGQSAHIRQYMKEIGTFTKMPKSEQARLNKDFLIIRGYAKGIPFENEEFLDKSGESWISDAFRFKNPKDGAMRIRLTLNWQTLRYKRAVEILNPDLSYRSEVAHWGRCEDVKPDVKQTANP